MVLSHNTEISLVKRRLRFKIYTSTHECKRHKGSKEHVVCVCVCLYKIFLLLFIIMSVQNVGVLRLPVFLDFLFQDYNKGLIF